MSGIDLTQAEADDLFSLRKHRIEEIEYEFPDLGGALRIPLKSEDRKQDYSLDITRGRIELKKNSFQNRARKTIVLARIDLYGSPHRNPDDELVPTPHLHLYRENMGTKWAQPLPANFTNPQDVFQSLDEFMDFCNIITKPSITKGLFT